MTTSWSDTNPFKAQPGGAYKRILNPPQKFERNSESKQKNCWLVGVFEGTLPETNKAPENGWLECWFSYWVSAYFQGLR